MGVYFSASGSIASVDIGLRGNTSSAYDGNYNASASGALLAGIGGNNFKVIFDADAATNLLPQSIIVNPALRTIKYVATSGYVGEFHTELTLNSATSSAKASSRNLGTAGNIPVYSTCAITSTTSETL